jgi:hypothetical protein
MVRVEGVIAPRFAMFISMPLLTELVSIHDGYGYRHGAPNGAVQKPNPTEDIEMPQKEASKIFRETSCAGSGA